MRGYVKKRAKSTYTIWIELPRAGGKRKRETLTVRGSLKDAEAKLAKRIAEVESGIVGTGSDTTVRQFVASWLERKRESDLAASTVQRYDELANRFIVPTLGDIVMTKLRPLHIESAIATWRKMLNAHSKEKKAVSQRTVHHAFSTLRTALGQAQRWNIIERNPCANVERVAKGRSIGNALDESQALELLDLLRGDQLEHPTLLAIMTGLRRGELLALRWQDVDFERASIQVSRSLEIIGTHELRFKQPKTPKSQRTVALPTQAIVALKRHRAQQRLHIMRHRDIYQENDLVFPNPEGAPWHPKRFSASFGHRMKQLKVRITFHGLRHSYASIPLRAGASLKVASEALGHSGVAITADLYTHVLGELQSEAAERLSSVFDRAMLRVRKG